jgi:CO dehydrogenase nickel-insertion accessory protein CooC1
MDEKRLEGLRIGIFGKGGAGKSTITVFLAAALQEAGYSALVLDADSTNQGLARALGMDREPEPLLDRFGGMVFSGGLVTCPVDDPTPLAGARVELDRLPARFVARNPEGICLLVAGKLGGLGPGAGCDGPIAKIARDLRITGQGPHPVTLVDFKAGFEDAARGALTTVDWALVVVDPTTAALRMARDLAAMVSDIHRGVPPATRHLEEPELVDLANRLFREARVRGVSTLLNRVPKPATEAYLRGSLEGSGAAVAAVFGEDPGIAEQWLRAEPLRSDGLLASGRALVGELERVVSGSDTRTPAMGGG